MAEIRIEKKNNSWIPWILGLMVLLLVGWLAFAGDDDDGMKEMTTMQTTEEAAPIAVRNDKADVNTTRGNPLAEIKPINLENFDLEWDGTASGYNENVIYYLNSVKLMDAQMGLDHDYSNIALRALANSLIVLAREQGLSEEVNIKQKVDLIRSNAAQITEDWRSTKHADLIKRAALAAADAMQTIQQKKFADLQEEVTAVKNAANQIDPATLTLEQKETMRSFFHSAADVLMEMREI